jgi:hypothetical protein
MTVYGAPPAWDRLNQKKREAVIQAMADWAETVRSQNMRPWVMFLPDSHRVFHGMIRYADTNGAVARWAPGEFGAHLGAACSNLNIRFIDTFPTLRKKAEAGEVPYNLVGDTHLSREGSRIVAEVLADALKAGPVP